MKKIWASTSTSETATRTEAKSKFTVKHAHRTRMQFIFNVQFCVFGIGYSALALHSLNTNNCSSGCLVQRYPFINFSGNCFCNGWVINCKERDWTENQLIEHMDTLPTTLEIIRLHHCPIRDAPTILSSWTLLKYLEIYHSQLEDFTLDLKLQHKQLRGLSIEHAPLQNVPNKLLQLPKSLKVLSISHTAIEQLPRYKLDWSNISFLYLRSNRLQGIGGSLRYLLLSTKFKIQN